mgnify:CR=1 FL=1
MKRIHSVGTVFRKKKNTRESVLDGSSQTPESPTTDRPGDTDDIDDDGDYELEGRISNQLNRFFFFLFFFFVLFNIQSRK